MYYYHYYLIFIIYYLIFYDSCEFGGLNVIVVAVVFVLLFDTGFTFRRKSDFNCDLNMLENDLNSLFCLYT